MTATTEGRPADQSVRAGWTQRESYGEQPNRRETAEPNPEQANLEQTKPEQLKPEPRASADWEQPPFGDGVLRYLYKSAADTPQLSFVRRAIEGALTPRDTMYRGLRWRLTPGDNEADRLIWLGAPSAQERLLDFLMRWIETQERPLTLCDIGAGFGMISLPLAVAAGPKARVIAVEPDPNALLRLWENVALNGLETVEPIYCTLDEAPGHPRLGSKQDDSVRTLLQSLLGAYKGLRAPVGAPGFAAPVETLGNLMAQRRAPGFDLLRVSAHGLEDAVLCPFFDIAPDSRLPRMIVAAPNMRGYWRRDLVSAARARGYDLSQTTPAGLVFERTADRAPIAAAVSDAGRALAHPKALEPDQASSDAEPGAAA